MCFPCWNNSNFNTYSRYKVIICIRIYIYRYVYFVGFISQLKFMSSNVGYKLRSATNAFLNRILVLLARNQRLMYVNTRFRHNKKPVKSQSVDNDAPSSSSDRSNTRYGRARAGKRPRGAEFCSLAITPPSAQLSEHRTNV